ncbi:protein-methionine-sulfoxide reductase catalytic subunit MsrP [Methylomonas fluvii]|uniref:Protein-methionine-sulfoxide reductase catalytic subunit MsrP n=1 Tax=Methylomonas fluvii TaxID=1854564 RepID=A0ABR9DHC1_9GAMM|nr:protein-methionine-sulfoxide reductase catalytic subunit MsrP [Methylomonas fluvii]MBD9361644.1 protein-methionine-sulfoxide reductase catalytic subunit MsrP [Methylomonas fluvii]CAD6874630.1 Protein-methionine-sulfoxide reductase catalytic subunit MsrP [Methylomonas fluvii]
MKPYKPPAIPSSEITPQALFQARRKFMQTAGGAALAAVWPQALWAMDNLGELGKSKYSAADELTPRRDVTQYNNFYEFGTSKDQPAINAGTLQTRPWTITVEGEVKKAQVFDIDKLLKMAALEERVYRLRCVEAWSMVVPWVGYSLAELLKRVEPTGNAKFVEFVSLHDPAQMPGQKAAVLDWPYREGLRMDEAMHPLTLLTFGLYGEVLPKQNGAPVRIVTPWKYGFKSAKSIVKIRLVEQQPLTSWMKAGPGEYGFYANVNPEVDHPRWSQAKERRIGEFLKRKTLMFNGYTDEVAALYAGMDLQRNF